METAHAYSSDIAFTPTIKAVQDRKDSRPAYRRMEERGSWQTRITPDLAAFIEAQTSIFLATPARKDSPTFSTAAGQRAFCMCSTRAPLASSIFPATGNTSARAISRTIPRPISS
jgi:hypothetical protein